MNEPFVSYDTLTIGADLDRLGDLGAGSAPDSKPLSILARLPRVPITPPEPRRNRFDEAEPTIPMGHLVDDQQMQGTSPGVLPVSPPMGDPIATIRFDTVATHPTTVGTPDAASQRTGTQPTKTAPPPEPAPEPDRPVLSIATPPSADLLEDPWSAWLLNLEATIQPYSRWIAMAAVIAALGLTIVLLRGGGGTASPPTTAPQVSTESIDATLAEADVETTTPEMTSWDVSPPAAPATTDEPRAIAVGPVSAPRPAGHATFTGEVLPAETPRVADSFSNESSSRITR